MADMENDSTGPDASGLAIIGSRLILPNIFRLILSDRSFYLVCLILKLVWTSDY